MADVKICRHVGVSWGGNDREPSLPIHETKPARNVETSAPDLNSVLSTMQNVGMSTQNALSNLFATTRANPADRKLVASAITVKGADLTTRTTVHPCNALTIEGEADVSSVVRAGLQSGCSELTLRGRSLVWSDLLEMIMAQPTLRCLNLVPMTSISRPRPPLRNADVKRVDEPQLERLTIESLDTRLLHHIHRICPNIKYLELRDCEIDHAFPGILLKFKMLSDLLLIDCKFRGGRAPTLAFIDDVLPGLTSLVTDWHLYNCDLTKLRHLEVHFPISDADLAASFLTVSALESLHIQGAKNFKQLPYINMPLLQRLTVIGSPAFDTNSLLENMCDQFLELGIHHMQDAAATAALAQWYVSEMGRSHKLPTYLRLDAETCLHIMCTDDIANVVRVIDRATDYYTAKVPRERYTTVSHDDLRSVTVTRDDLARIKFLLNRGPFSRARSGIDDAWDEDVDIHGTAVQCNEPTATDLTVMLTGEPIHKLDLEYRRLTQAQLERILKSHPEIRVLNISGNEVITDMASLRRCMSNVETLTLGGNKMLTPVQVLSLMLETDPNLPRIRIRDDLLWSLRDYKWITYTLASKLCKFAKTRQNRMLKFDVEPPDRLTKG